ncbi:MAG TPA: hypothetical protein VHC19_01140, partial [Pirellulales bacterium]|nr:hypothetical protein [Pirellulales bacterium]
MAALAIVFLCISLGPALLVGGGLTFVLVVTVRKFPRETRSRSAAITIAALASAVCLAWIGFVIWDIYQPVIKKEPGGTNGMILLFAPTFLSSFALVPASVVWGVLLLWLKQTRSRPASAAGRLLATIAVLAGAAAQAADDGSVAVWKSDVRIRPVSSVAGRHSIHSYYVANPESPDGTRVLFFTSTHAAGYVGEVRMLTRATGEETVLAENVHVEDAHRAACQQWLSGGKRVAWHEVIDGQWRVVVVDTGSLQKSVAAEDRQVGFGRGDGDLLPMYGCHWNPGAYRDLYLYDARDGQTRTPLTIGMVEAVHGPWLQRTFGDQPTSIFFPVLSPDQQRVFFKMAAGNGGDNYMAKDASRRQGLMCVDLTSGKLEWFR